MDSDVAACRSVFTNQHDRIRGRGTGFLFGGCGALISRSIFHENKRFESHL
jgi:hypothetical protein